MSPAPARAALEALVPATVVFAAVALAGQPVWAQAVILACAAAGGALTLACGSAAVEAPLLRPGLALAGLGVLQLVPLPPAWRPVTLRPADTAVVCVALLALLALHAAANAAFERREARERFFSLLALLGLALATQALAQDASWTWRLYWTFDRHGDSIPFGGFWNRNHYAMFVAALVPLAMRSLDARLEPLRTLRGSPDRWLLALHHLNTREGAWLAAYLFSVLVMLASLVACRSRGGLLAVAVALLVASRGRRSRLLLVLAALGVLLGLYRAGAAELAHRFAQLDEGRLTAWALALGSLQGARFIAGYGLGAFADGAPTVVAHWRAHNVVGMASSAHSEYVQALVETGLLGFGLVLWGLWRALRAARSDRYLLASLAALATHALFDVGLHTPAVAVLSATLCAASQPAGARASR